jgi:hypothetical protein
VDPVADPPEVRPVEAFLALVAAQIFILLAERLVGQVRFLFAGA